MSKEKIILYVTQYENRIKELEEQLKTMQTFCNSVMELDCLNPEGEKINMLQRTANHLENGIYTLLNRKIGE